MKTKVAKYPTSTRPTAYSPSAIVRPVTSLTTLAIACWSLCAYTYLVAIEYVDFPLTLHAERQTGIHFNNTLFMRSGDSKTDFLT